MDNLEFLGGAEAPDGEAAPVVEAPAADQTPVEPVTAEAVAEEPKGPVRGPDGKFAKKEAGEPVMVPLAALHETRDKVRDLEARLAAVSQPQAQQPQVPDMFEDPEGYQAYLANSVRETVLNQTLNISEEMTRQQVGAELVDEATAWAKQAFQANPGFYQAFVQQRNPYGFLVSEYQRQQALSQIGSDPQQIAAFLAWQQAQQAAPQPGATPQPQQQRPTSSIASATSAGGVQHTATGPGVAFDNGIR